MTKPGIFQIEYHCPECGSITPIIPGITACLGCKQPLQITQVTLPPLEAIRARIAEMDRCAFAVCDDGSLIAVRGPNLTAIQDAAWALVEAPADLVLLLDIVMTLTAGGNDGEP